MYNYNIPKEALITLELLENSGFKAYLVGGCVRDLILNRKPDDYDITTNALPEQIIDVFKNYKTIPTGIKHGTVTVIINSFKLEVTTFRKDGKYSDNRHPDKVEFTLSLEDDLVRRDFSINALAYNQNIIDIYNGTDDIKNKLIRCIKDPDKRFEEDALRILRALRFSSQLGFEIEKSTAESVHRNACKLKNISAERINTEFEKLLNGKNPYPILKEYQDVIKIFIPEYIYTEPVLQDNQVSPLIKRSAFFLGLKNINIKNIMKRLKYSNKDIHDTVKLVEYFNYDIKTKIDLKLLLLNLETELVRDLLKFMRASGKETEVSEKMLDEILSNNECYKISQLAINGNDLIGMGFSGTEIGKILDNLLHKVIYNELENNKQSLKSYLK